MKYFNLKKINKKILFAVCLFSLVVFSASFAYFQNQIGDNKSVKLNVMTYSLDMLTFSTGEDVNLNVSYADFTKGKNSPTAETFAKAMLKANNETNEATMSYYLYLSIGNNSFEYTQDSNTPEFLVQITDKNGNDVKSVNGLKYVTVTDGSNESFSGFDITTKSGLVPIFISKEISAAPTNEDIWNFKFIFVNYDLNQTDNTEKDFNAKIIIQKDEYKVQYISDVCNNGSNAANCLANLYNAATDMNTNLYSLTNDGVTEYRYSGPGDDFCEMNYSIVSANGSDRTTKDSCKQVYKVADVLYEYSAGLDKSSSVEWDSENNKCVTSNDKHEVVNYYYSGPLSINNCKGTAYYSDNIPVAFLDLEYLGAGTWNESESACYYGDDKITDYYSESNASACENVLRYRSERVYDYFDADFLNDFKELDVEWDSSNNICKTKYSYDITVINAYNEAECTGKAYENYELQKAYLKNSVSNVGAGNWRKGVENYLCFGSDASPCPDEYLFRIVGVFDNQIKLVKATYATNQFLGTNGTYNSGYAYDDHTYYWNNTTSNIWENSALNRVNLNTNYLNTFDDVWIDKIADTIWKVGGAKASVLSSNNAYSIYYGEITNTYSDNTVSATYGPAKIGLLYFSDYAFMFMPRLWGSLPSKSYSFYPPYWLEDQLSITRTSDSESLLSGLNGSFWKPNELYGRIYPAFYLKSDITYKSGTGEVNNPIRIN